jgi:hypothetical protein
MSLEVFCRLESDATRRANCARIRAEAGAPHRIIGLARLGHSDPRAQNIFPGHA